MDYLTLCKPYGVVLLVCPFTPRLHLLRDAVTTGGDRGICRAFAWQYADRDDYRRRDAARLFGRDLNAGGNVPSDPALAACISIPIAVKAGMDPNLAIALAIPFGVIGVFLDQLRRTLNAAWVHMADKHAETANMAGIMRCAFLYPALLGLVLRFPVVFAANYFGQDVVESFLKLMPHWLTHSFEIMGGILPALGFAITIMVIGKKSLLPWFIGGFFAVLYLKVDIMAMAIFGTCVAFLIKGLAKNEGAA
ncbi:PTS system protein [Salmonella enterica subsp. enterica]|uniref:PTS system protein n=1 Tax=Salmonella enterica I TaxID=59201 RepID=A0A379WJV1_SALET|nr:PTS system protein [Salmonella enterica subsp. enterica]